MDFSLGGALPWALIIVSVLLSTAVLLQRSSESGLGAVGGDLGGASYYTKRGFERSLFIGTIVLGIVFALLSLLLFLGR